MVAGKYSALQSTYGQDRGEDGTGARQDIIAVEMQMGRIYNILAIVELQANSLEIDKVL